MQKSICTGNGNSFQLQFNYYGNEIPTHFSRIEINTVWQTFEFAIQLVFIIPTCIFNSFNKEVRLIVSFLLFFLFNKLLRNHVVTVRNAVVVHYLNLSDEAKVGQCKRDCRLQTGVK